MFAVPIGVFAQLAGLDWVPAPQPLPSPDGLLLTLLVAPLSEEMFFRACAFAALDLWTSGPLDPATCLACLAGPRPAH